jgi:hypothetical protein
LKVDLFIARFPYGRVEDYEVGSFITRTVVSMKKDQRIGDIHTKAFNDTPITMTRNAAIKEARNVKADLLLMIDNDMVPDCCLATSDRPPLHYRPDGHVKPFWESSFEYMLHHDGPSIIAAPYCGPPPHENIFVFHWDNIQSDHPNADIRLSQYNRHDAACRSGFEEVAALPTGLILIDMRIFDEPSFKPPYFKYEWADETESEKASTEDVFFTRNASVAGFKVYCNWYAWAGHVKKKVVLPPTLLTPDSVNKQFREAVASNNMRSDQTLHFLKTNVKAG